MNLQVKEMKAVGFHALLSAVQDKLCKVPLGQMFPPSITRDEVENQFIRVIEGHSNGAFVSLYLEPDGWDSKEWALIKKAARELTNIEDRVLLHYSW